MSHTAEEAGNKSTYDPIVVEASLRRVVMGWFFGSMFFSITTGAAFTSFLKRFLEISDLAYGLIIAAGPAAVLFNLLGSYSVERSGRSKPNFMRYLILGRALWLGIAAIPFVAPDAGALWPVACVGLIVFFSNVSSTFGGAGFIVWMSELVPKSNVGSFFGRRARVGLLMMVLISTIVSVLLDRFPEAPWMYAAVFGFGTVVGIIDLLWFIKVPEIPRPVEEHPLTLWSVVKTPWQNAQFRGYAWYTVASLLAYSMMWPFMWPFCFEPASNHGLGLSLPLTNLLIVVVPQLANAYTAPFWGRAIDRFGPKPVLGVGAISAIILPVFWVAMQSRYGMSVPFFGRTVHMDMVVLIPLVTVLGGLSWPAIDQGMLHVQLHGFPEARRSTYIAANGMLQGWAAMVGSALGGVIAAAFTPFVGKVAFLPTWFSQYQAVFAVSIVFRLLSFVFLYQRLDLPGGRGYGEAAAMVVDEAVGPIRRLLPRKLWVHPRKRRGN